MGISHNQIFKLLMSSNCNSVRADNEWSWKYLTLVCYFDVYMKCVECISAFQVTVCQQREPFPWRPVMERQCSLMWGSMRLGGFWLSVMYQPTPPSDAQLVKPLIMCSLYIRLLGIISLFQSCCCFCCCFGQSPRIPRQGFSAGSRQWSRLLAHIIESGNTGGLKTGQH